jgi:hypothetical protein
MICGDRDIDGEQPTQINDRIVADVGLTRRAAQPESI